MDGLSPEAWTVISMAMATAGSIAILYAFTVALNAFDRWRRRRHRS